MKKAEKVWVVGTVLFWASFVATFLVDYLGVIETSNMGFVETVWISWIMWTLVLGFAVAILTRFVAEK
jgi:uncharacterized PurR-regulated membrane protein YhhQ (DUF165 family)